MPAPAGLADGVAALSSPSRLLLSYREPGAHTLTGGALRGLPAALPSSGYFTISLKQ